MGDSDYLGRGRRNRPRHRSRSRDRPRSYTRFRTALTWSPDNVRGRREARPLRNGRTKEEEEKGQRGVGRGRGGVSAGQITVLFSGTKMFLTHHFLTLFCLARKYTKHMFLQTIVLYSTPPPSPIPASGDNELARRRSDTYRPTAYPWAATVFCVCVSVYQVDNQESIL